jgi:hypothetical protein
MRPILRSEKSFGERDGGRGRGMCVCTEERERERKGEKASEKGVSEK